MAVKANWQNGEQFNASDANAVAEAVNAAYVKPTGGVPITDLTASVQVSLGKADTAVQSVNAASITDSTTTGRAVITAVDAAAARTTLGVSYGSTAGTVVEGNDSRLSPSSTSITDSTATGRSLITAVDPAAARSAIGVAYGSTGGTVAQGNDSRIVGAEQAANKGVANGYASLDSGGKVPVAQLPNSIMEYQGTFNASTGSPALANGTGNTGDVYRVTVAGTQNFGAGNISFEVGDYVIYNGSVWEKSDTTDAVSTVAGLTGDVSASSLRGAIATGTPSSTTWLRGDGAWATLPASGITRSVQTITTPTTLGAAANTDYVYFLNSYTTYSTSTDSSWSSVTSMLKFDGVNASTTFSDYANSPTTWSASGNAQISTTKSKFGGTSGSFSSGYITGASSQNFNMSGSAFTVECWINPTSYVASAGVFGQRIGADYQPFVIVLESSGSLVWLISNAGVSGWSAVTGATGTVPLNTWTHVALVGTGSNLTLYQDGVSVLTTTQPTWTSAARNMYIGSQAGGSFNGYIDEFRVTKGVARYTSNFTPTSTGFSAANIPTTTVGTPTLPTAVGNTNRYSIKNISSDNAVVSTTGSQTIDGNTNFSLPINDCLEVVSDSANWRIV